MSGAGNCYDNAAMERFFHTLKTEHVYFEHYCSREQAKCSIFEYVEVFYNRQRLHSTLGYVTPNDVETKRGFSLYPSQQDDVCHPIMSRPSVFPFAP
ncbi:IS3 family transposase [Legionella sp.]|uniref:IS3 family transposase n=1 Tax=Legionella sp. TaxID=459 RepID=UPI003CC6AFD5